MCLISFAWQQDPHYPLILIANRDEFYDRPTAPMARWQDQPDIIAGRDLQQGGTWLGVSRHGRLAAITNYRSGQRETDKLSRGALTRDYLASELSAEAWICQQLPKLHLYGGFNLILGDSEGLWYCSNRQPGYKKLEAGIYGLSNALLDTPWPKLSRLKQQLGMALQQQDLNEENLLQALAEPQQYPDQLLPDTGISMEWERSLSACFIRLEAYGTRASSLISLDNQGRLRFTERSFDYAGVTGQQTLELSGFTLGESCAPAKALSPATPDG